jgi:hypothetical protein
VKSPAASVRLIIAAPLFAPLAVAVPLSAFIDELPPVQAASAALSSSTHVSLVRRNRIRFMVRTPDLQHMPPIIRPHSRGTILSLQRDVSGTAARILLSTYKLLERFPIDARRRCE